MDLYLTIRILRHDVYARLIAEAKRRGVTPDAVVWEALDILLTRAIDSVIHNGYNNDGGDNMRGTPIISLRLSAEWTSWAKHIAEDQDCSVSDVIRKALQEYVWTHYSQDEAKETKK